MIKSASILAVPAMIIMAPFSPTALADSPSSEANSGDPGLEVSEARMRGDMDTIVGFGTRHTLSTQTDPNRGIGAAVDWGAEVFRDISAECGNCLEVELPETMVSGDRIPEPVRLRNVVAIQPGTERPNEVVIVQGHIDSRASAVMDGTVEAPGANDDGSGTALVIEAARVLSGQQYPTTIVYALLSGEEQGLFGARLLVDWVESKGYMVKAVLNNDVVGNSCGSDGYCDAAHVRVFSEGPRADLDDRYRAAQRREGWCGAPSGCRARCAPPWASCAGTARGDGTFSSTSATHSTPSSPPTTPLAGATRRRPRRAVRRDGGTRRGARGIRPGRGARGGRGQARGAGTRARGAVRCAAGDVRRAAQSRGDALRGV